MSYSLKTEKTIARPASEVFRALSEGLLFMNCGSDSGTLKIDFRVGGKYHIEFHNHTKFNGGEFLEIIPNKKIVFTWAQSFDPKDWKPDTQVTIELNSEGEKTRLTLQHTGFKDEALCKAHEMGWSTGMRDMADELENGRLRFFRTFPVSAETLFSLLKTPTDFFGLMGDVSKGAIDFKVGGSYQVPTKSGHIKGEFTEIVPSKKIKLTWREGCGQALANSNVTLVVNQKDDGQSTLELVHDGLNTPKLTLAHRQGWEYVTKQMASQMANLAKM